ncbi:MAG: hypothetical protein IK025_06340 [Bacteroidales bacterium]|nr:hypothetical protein [Bacteroidales bacterium]
MKKLLFIGMIAFASCFAMTSCGSKITEADVQKVEDAINAGNCDEAAKIVEGWKGKTDFDAKGEEKWSKVMENENMDLDCMLKMIDALQKVAE